MQTHITLIEDQEGPWYALYKDGEKVFEDEYLDLDRFREVTKGSTVLFTLVRVLGPTEADPDDVEAIPPTYEWDDNFPKTLPQDLTTLPGYQA